MSVPSSGPRARPASMILSGQIDFSRFNPANAPRTPAQIRQANNQQLANKEVNAAAIPVIANPLPQPAPAARALTIRPRSMARKPSRAFIHAMGAAKSDNVEDVASRSPSPERQVAVSSSSSVDPNPQLSNDNNVSSSSSSPVKVEVSPLQKRMRDCLRDLCSFKGKINALNMLRDDLMIFFENPEHILGGEGFTDEFIIDAARVYRIIEQEPQNYYSSIFVWFNGAAFSIIKSEKNLLKPTDAVIRAFAQRCYISLSKELEDTYKSNPSITSLAQYCLKIATHAKAEGLIQLADRDMDVEAPLSNDNDYVADNDDESDEDVAGPVAQQANEEFSISYVQASYIEKLEAKLAALEEANRVLTNMNTELNEGNRALRDENAQLKADKATIKERLRQIIIMQCLEGQ